MDRSFRYWRGSTMTDKDRRDMISAIDAIANSDQPLDPAKHKKFYETYGTFLRHVKYDENRWARMPMIVKCILGAGVAVSLLWFMS
jgi:hypothetical protein